MRIIFFLISSLFFSTALLSQSIVADTIYIDFIADSIIPSQTYLKKVTDNRNLSPCLISYTTRKKFIFIPIDQEICTKSPLNKVIKEGINTTSPSIVKDTFALEINHFIINKYKGQIFTFYVLEADLNLLKDDSIQGTLTYNLKSLPGKRRTPKALICQELLSQWDRQFKLDLLSSSLYLKDPSIAKPDNFLLETFKRPSFLNTTAAVIVGLNFWQIDGEIYFSRAETSKPQTFQAGIIRYQSTEEFEMIGFGKKSAHYTTRINDKLLFDVNSNFLIGINKWKASDTIKLQQIFQFSFSSTQSINLDKKNQAGWILKTGLFENFYYIIEKNPKLQFGIYLSTGYKF
jgi:uncharacterized protein YuzE